MRRALPLTVSATAAVVITGLAVSGLAVSANASASDDATLVSKTNAARSGQGLPSYAVADDLTAAARQHAARMAASGTIYHDPNLGSSVCCWTSLGDNVGAGPDASSVHNAFMASSEHRDNILSSTYTQVGIGTARGSDGRLYVDEIFRRPSGAAAPVAAAPAPAAAPPPAAPQQQAAARPPVASRSVQRVPTQTELLAGRLSWVAAHYQPLPGDYDPVRQSLRFDAIMTRLSAQSG